MKQQKTKRNGNKLQEMARTARNSKKRHESVKTAKTARNSKKWQELQETARKGKKWQEKKRNGKKQEDTGRNRKTHNSIDDEKIKEPLRRGRERKKTRIVISRQSPHFLGLGKKGVNGSRVILFV